MWKQSLIWMFMWFCLSKTLNPSPFRGFISPPKNYHICSRGALHGEGLRDASVAWRPTSVLNISNYAHSGNLPEKHSVRLWTHRPIDPAGSSSDDRCWRRALWEVCLCPLPIAGCMSGFDDWNHEIHIISHFIYNLNLNLCNIQLWFEVWRILGRSKLLDHALHLRDWKKFN